METFCNASAPFEREAGFRIHVVYMGGGNGTVTAMLDDEPIGTAMPTTLAATLATGGTVADKARPGVVIVPLFPSRRPALDVRPVRVHPPSYTRTPFRDLISNPDPIRSLNA